MTTKSLNLPDDLHRYLLEVSLREPPVFQQLREETASHPLQRMQIAPEQGQFLALLIELIGARKVLEIGVFTGYSSLWMAQALPPNGQLVACDVNEEWTSVARRYWQKTGLEHKIELHLRPALETLDELIGQGDAAESFDLAFIDADKENDEAYFERCLKLIRPGGLIVVDNVLWSGLVIDPAAHDAATESIRNLNAKLYRDERVSLSMIPVADGLTLALKRR